MKHVKPSWLYGTSISDVTRQLWDCGFRADIIRDENFDPKLDPFEWYTREAVSVKGQQKRLKAILDSDFTSNRTILSTCEEVDGMAMSLAALIARRALEKNSTVKVYDLADQNCIHRIKREFELSRDNGYDVIVGHNFTIGSTRERTEKARDFCNLELDTMKVLVSVGAPIDLARKMYFNRFAGAFYQGRVMIDKGNHFRRARRVIGTEER